MARTNATRRQVRNPNTATITAIKAKLDEHDAALDAVAGSVAADINEHISAAGALAPGVQLTTLAIDNTKAYTLAAGTKVGQRKTIRCTAATNTPAGSIAATYLNGATPATSVAMNAAEDSLAVVWNGSAWCIVSAVSLVIT
jgi:hypothetical protein